MLPEEIEPIARDIAQAVRGADSLAFADPRVTAYDVSLIRQYLADLADAVTELAKITKCEGCRVSPAIGQVSVDPYDVISGSPILRPVRYCLTCYNDRVLAALRWITRPGRGSDA